MRIDVGLGITSLAVLRRAGSGAAPVTNGIIHDVDNDSDVGDVLNTLVAINAGERNRNINTILGFVATSALTSAASCIKAQLDAYGYAAVPVGATADPTNVGNLVSRSNPSPGYPFHSDIVRDQFRPGDTRTNYPSEVAAYKAMLAQGADGTVKVVVTGGMTSIGRRVFADAPALALVAQKVSGFYVMGGRFDGGSPAAEANIQTDPDAANAFVANLPPAIPVIWAGFETGTAISNLVPSDIGLSAATDPSKKAWDSWSPTPGTQGELGLPCWDYVATWIAQYGLGADPVNGGALFALSAPGTPSFSAGGVTTWTPSAGGQHRYVSLVAPTRIIQAIMQSEIYDVFNRRDPAWAAAHAAEAGKGHRGLRQFFGRLDEGSGTSVADSSGKGRTAGTLTNGPGWVTEGVSFDGTNDYISVPSHASFNGRQLFLSAVIRPTSFAGTPVIMARDDGSANRQFHFRLTTAGFLELVCFNGTTAVITASTGALSTNAWALVSAEIADNIVTLRVGDTIVKTGDMGAPTSGVATPRLTLTAATPLTVGARGTGSNPFAGRVACFSIGRRMPASHVAAELADMRAVAAGKGIGGI